MASITPGTGQRFADRLPWVVITALVVCAAILRVSFTACDYIAHALTLLALVWAAFRLLKRLCVKHCGTARRLRRLLIIGLCLFGLWFGGTELYLITGAGGSPAAQTDYVVVLGAQVRGDVPSRSLKDRIGAATDYLNAHPNTICIVSGGQGPGENLTEAACMAAMLEENGISPQRIWREDKATNTAENIACSAQLIAERTGKQPSAFAVISGEYHLRRAHLTASRQGIEAICVAAPTSLLYVKINYFIREAFGLWYYWLLG